jgi:hypothetical protein
MLFLAVSKLHVLDYILVFPKSVCISTQHLKSLRVEESISYKNLKIVMPLILIFLTEQF